MAGRRCKRPLRDCCLQQNLQVHYSDTYGRAFAVFASDFQKWPLITLQRWEQRRQSEHGGDIVSAVPGHANLLTLGFLFALAMIFNKELS